MQITPLSISDVKLLSLQKFKDDRGFFVETFREDTFNTAIGGNIQFVQENHSYSKSAFTVRGLHHQSAPKTQGKLVRCTNGRIMDVVVDARPKSNTFGDVAQTILSEESDNLLWIPAGFLHGFATLEPNTEVHYKCTEYYAPENGVDVYWNDPELNIDWGFDTSLAVLSKKDREAQSFAEFMKSLR